MAAVVAFPSSAAFYQVQSVRRIAQRAGLDAKQESACFVRSGYSRAYLSDLSERARQARMARTQPGGAA